MDLPELHCYDTLPGDQFMEALADTDNIEYFANRGIQTIIDFKWPLAKEYTIKKLFIPFIAYLICFFVYSNLISEMQMHAPEG